MMCGLLFWSNGELKSLPHKIINVICSPWCHHRDFPLPLSDRNVKMSEPREFIPRASEHSPHLYTSLLPPHLTVALLRANPLRYTYPSTLPPAFRSSQTMLHISKWKDRKRRNGLLLKNVFKPPPPPTLHQRVTLLSWNEYGFIVLNYTLQIERISAVS